MTSRELIVLGTASQAPTRHRNHNGYALRWDDQLIVFDPGEGFQRQCVLADLKISRATACCITHFHGDHSLGLPGFLQRRVMDGAKTALPIWYPADGDPYLDRLQTSTIWNDPVGVEKHPVDADGQNGMIGNLRVITRHLDHRVTTVGYRLQEPDRLRLDGPKLAAAGISGRAIRELSESGNVVVADSAGEPTRHLLADYSSIRPGQSMAFIMDTRMCDSAFELADGVDMLVCESTYLETESHLATKYGHLTALQAATIASEAGAKQLVLTHFSQRHPDSSVFVAEAEPVFENVLAASDLARIPLLRN